MKSTEKLFVPVVLNAAVVGFCGVEPDPDVSDVLRFE